MRIQNPVTHHPFLSGIKIAILFFLVPFYNNGMAIGNADFWSWYGWVVAVFYPLEILCFILFFTGNKNKIDNTRDYGDQPLLYAPYDGNCGSPYIYDITNPNTPPFNHHR